MLRLYLIGYLIAILLVAMIYTGSKRYLLNILRKHCNLQFRLIFIFIFIKNSLQYLSIPIYTIFKNLTIILIAYGEILWFGGNITRLTMTSFLLMVLSSILEALSGGSNA